MKKSLTIVALLAGAVGAYAQGTINWADYIFPTFSITVWSPQNIPTLAAQQTGNSSFDLPGGSTSYQGVPIGGSTGGEVIGGIAYGNGANFTVGLYAVGGAGNNAQLLAAELTGAPIATAAFLSAGGIGTGNAGINGNDSAGIWGVSANQTAFPVPSATAGATLAIGAWYNPGGNTYATEALAAAAGVPAGFSPMESVSQLGGEGGPPTTTSNLGQHITAGGITSFSLTEVPEPSTIALGVIGASTLLFRRRK
jgi:hypothetical protein